MTIPVKPFPSYKWRWLSVTPSEGLLKAPVFLGVLRALEQYEGEPFSSIGLHHELARVKEDTGTNIDLARTPERNLFRNSGQYWRGTGLIVPVSGEIRLTSLGHRVASGGITSDEFATLMVRNTVLPNPQTDNAAELKKWHDADLRIKPLELIISIMDRLGRTFGLPLAFLTPNELIKIVIPLAGIKTSVSDIAKAVQNFRNGILDVSSWPDCAPDANDKRLAREFLLFLVNFDICYADEAAKRYDQKFYLDQVLSIEVEPDARLSFLENEEIIDDEISISRDSEIPIIIERKRIATSVIKRTNQPRFRREVLSAANTRCILTNETTTDVLEAAHIVPVEHGGTDLAGNGLCMRVDIHRLFDGGKIRIASDGLVILNDQIENAVSYVDLPRNIIFPTSVHLANIEWRSRYL